MSRQAANPTQMVLFDAETDRTLAFYEREAASYAQQTASADLRELHNRFLSLAPAGAILDAGSGSGRDTLAFIARERAVDAFDASQAMAAISTERTGIKTQVARLETFTTTKRYAGIWACASLLHVAQHQLSNAIGRLATALLPDGVLFMSFKYGEAQHVTEDGRRYTDLNEATLGWHIHTQAKLKFHSLWVSDDLISAKVRSPWLNALAFKKTRSRSAHE